MTEIRPGRPKCVSPGRVQPQRGQRTLGIMQKNIKPRRGDILRRIAYNGKIANLASKATFAIVPSGGLNLGNDKGYGLSAHNPRGFYIPGRWPEAKRFQNTTSDSLPLFLVFFHLLCLAGINWLSRFCMSRRSRWLCCWGRLNPF